MELIVVLVEIGCVVWSGGVFGFIWNFCDDCVEWVWKFIEIMYGSYVEFMFVEGDLVVVVFFGLFE